MEDDWTPLPPRAKRSRERPTDAAAEEEAASSGAGAGASKEVLDQVNEAVKKRASLHRPERGHDMGQDGVAGEFYEYLDHTADVQLHAWGPTLTAAFEHIVPCMFNYMTDISTIEVDDSKAQEFEVDSHDLPSLLFQYLDEFLYRFNADGLVCKSAAILEFDREKFRIRVRAEGETFDLTKHPQGTEVKAITYSNMQIHEKPERSDLYVIIDI